MNRLAKTVFHGEAHQSLNSGTTHYSETDQGFAEDLGRTANRGENQFDQERNNPGIAADHVRFQIARSNRSN